MEERKPQRRRWTLRLRAGIVLLLLAVAWFSGGCGRLLLWGASRWGTPRRYGDVALERISTAGAEVRREGVFVSLSPARALQLAREVLGWKAWLVPPGLLPPDLTVSGSVSVPPNDPSTSAGRLPWLLRLDPEMGHPLVKATIPSAWFNAWLDADEDSFTNQTKTKRYPLGHYELTQRITFRTARLSARVDPEQGRKPITHRRVMCEATGSVRYRFKDSLVSARTTATVSRMEVHGDINFLRYADGIAVSYDVRITELEGDFHNVNRIFESSLEDLVRETLEEALNRPRKKARLVRKRFPLWLPLDLEFDLEVVSPGS